MRQRQYARQGGQEKHTVKTKNTENAMRTKQDERRKGEKPRGALHAQLTQEGEQRRALGLARRGGRDLDIEERAERGAKHHEQHAGQVLIIVKLVTK